MKRFLCLNAGAALLLLLTVISPQQMQATVILEGSDSIAFHCHGGTVGGACLYTGQVWTALDGSSHLPIAVIEGTVPIALGPAGSGITIDNFSSVAAAGPLSNYAAVYFEGDGGDNEGPEGDAAISASGAQAAVSAYLAGGGTIMIEDYTGGAAWDFAVGAGGNGNLHVAGAGGGAPVSTDFCDDGETVTAVGTANGFTQPPAIGCWNHQGYDESFFGALGFTKSFFDAGPGLVGGATTGWSGLLSNGSTLTGSTVPEPSSIATLSGLMLLGIGAIRRRRAQQ